MNDAGNGGAAYSSGVAGLGLANMPAPDSLQEFKVESGNQNAEYRAVASVTMVTKAGANAFHSTSYEYLQNTVLNANQFLLNATGQPRPISKLNQFGADLGGRIIPNRLFFYGAYRGVKQKTTGTTNLTLPSMAMRQGDFSALCRSYVAGVCAAGAGTQLYNPFTGAPFPNNQIPSNLITSQAKTLLGYLPAPTDSSSTGLPNGTPNYIAPKTNDIGINGVDYRMDAVLSPKDSAVRRLPLVERIAMVPGEYCLSDELWKPARLRIHGFRYQCIRDSHLFAHDAKRISRCLGRTRQRSDWSKHGFQAVVAVSATAGQ